MGVYAYVLYGFNLLQLCNNYCVLIPISQLNYTKIFQFITKKIDNFLYFTKWDVHKSHILKTWFRR